MRRNYIRLIVRFVWIVAFAAVMGLMWVRGWQPGTVLHTTVWDTAELFDVGAGRPIEVMMSVLFGIYFGTLSLFTLDWRKRVQGLLLFLGTATVLAVLWNRDMLLVHLEPTPVNGAAFIAGVVALGILERNELYTLMRELSFDDLEFDRALALLFLIVSVVVSSAWVQVYLVGEMRFVIDTAATVGLLYLLVGFFRFSSSSTTTIVGPKQSGKTTTLLGLYQAFNERRENVTEPTKALDDLQSQVSDMSEGDDWPIEGTTAFEEIGFYHVIGGFFPRRYRISGRDFPGETLDELASHLDEDPTLRRRLRNFFSDVQTLLLPGYSPPAKEQFYRETRNTDLAILIIDIERILQTGVETEIHKLRRVGYRVRENGGDVLVVATKVDLVLKDLLGMPEASIDEAQDLADAETIKETLNETLQQRSQISDMLADVGCDEIHPLYYLHYENEDGQLVPKLDEYGELQSEGHEELAVEVERILHDA